MASDTAVMYQDAYSAFSDADGASSGFLKELREAAWARFCAQGLPTSGRGSELWKYANLSPITGGQFRVQTALSTDLTREQLAQLYPWDFSCPTAVLVNGIFAPDLSSCDAAGVQIMSLADALKAQPDLVQRNLGKISRRGDEDNAFISLNTALIGSAAVCVVEDNVKLTSPVQIISVTDSAHGQQTAAFPRVLCIIGDNADVTLLDATVSVGDTDSGSLSAGVYEFALGRDAVLNHYRAQLDAPSAYQINHTRIQQSQGSNYNAVSLALGAALGRYDIHVGLAEQYANCDLFGLYLTKGTEHQGSEISTTHAVPHCTSKQYFKGILSGKSRAVFSGKVVVDEGAIKTDAEQKDLNLLLSRGAEIDTKPSLEIYADDVTAGHGATAGHLDESTLFYLRSRGLSLAEAMRIQTLGFASEVIDRAEDEYVSAFYEQVLQNELPKLLDESDLLS